MGLASFEGRVSAGVKLREAGFPVGASLGPSLPPCASTLTPAMAWGVRALSSARGWGQPAAYPLVSPPPAPSGPGRTPSALFGSHPTHVSLELYFPEGEM